jgi:hypothetical protein
MPDGRNHRNGARIDGSRNALVVKDGEIVRAAAASAENEDIRIGQPIHHFNRRDDLRGGFGPLNGDRIEQNFSERPPALQNLLNIVQRRPGTGGDDADFLWIERNRPLVLGCEEAFLRELLLELLKGKVVCAETLG